MSIESVMLSNHCILCHPLLLLPSIFPSIRVFFSDSALRIRWPKYWSFSFSISPSNEYSGLISFRMDWFDLLAVQGAFKSLLQHHSSKHQYCSALTSVHDYWKTIALTIQTSVGKITSLLFNTLSRFVIVWVLAFNSFECIHMYNYVGFSLFESTVCFSQRLYHFTLPPCKIWGFQFLHFLINTCYFSFFKL